MRISDWSSDVCSSDLSVTNCSVGSNVTLRYGGTRKDYQRINGTQPSIWAYARKAGLRTVYIDSQRTGGALQNMMTDEERRSEERRVGKGGVSKCRSRGSP